MTGYNRTHMAGENLRRNQPGSGTSEVCSFSKLGLPSTHWGMDEVALPLDVNGLLKLEWGFYHKEGAHETCLSQWSGIVPLSHDASSRQSYLAFQCFIWRQRNSPVGTLLMFYVKHPNDWFHTLFDMFLKDCNGAFRVFAWMKCSRLMKMDYWAEHAIGYLDINYGTLWNKSVIYCRTGIPGSALWWSSKVSE